MEQSLVATVLKQRYEILREVGRGGFGRTFLALDRCVTPGRHVAIKQLQPLLAKPQQFQWVRERFEREAAVLAQLSSHCRQVPHFYDRFTEGGNCYLVQEWIEGTTLTQRVRDRGPLGPEAVAQLLQELLPVLMDVHQNRTIHRDIKPDNIILRASDGLPVLIDFGAVKEVMALGKGGQPVSSTVAIGTPGYMAPEQAAGRPVYSSDLYSLALTALFLLLGRSPQDFETDGRTGEILWQQELPHLNGALQRALSGALRFHPRERFGGAGEMLAVLQGHGSQQLGVALPGNRRATTTAATAAYSVPPTYVIGNPADSANSPSHLRSFLLAAIATAVTAAGVGFAMVRLNRPPQIVVEAPEPSTPVSAEPPPIAEFPDPTFPPIELPPEETPASDDSPDVDEETVPDIVIDIVPAPPDEEKTPVPQPPDRSSRPNAVAFAPGIATQTVRDRLGAPTSDTPGRLPNTRELRYNDAIAGVDLVFREDTNTQRLRFSQAILAAQAKPELAEDLLAQMLGGQLNPNMRRVLGSVLSDNADLRSFQTQQAAVTIQRLPDRRLALSVIPK